MAIVRQWYGVVGLSQSSQIRLAGFFRVKESTLPTDMRPSPIHQINPHPRLLAMETQLSQSKIPLKESQVLTFLITQWTPGVSQMD
jgi:hypothetical protein